MKLLSTNTKLEKIPNAKKRYLVRGLAMAPHTMSGRNLCPWAAGCAAVCVLWFAGRTVMQSVRDAMIRRAKLFFDNRQEFKRILGGEIAALVRAARKIGAVPVIRLNVASDVVWERVMPEIFKLYPDLVAYDYTKAPYEKRKITPENYHITHSVHENSSFQDLSNALDAGRNIAVVVDAWYNPRKNKTGNNYGILPGFIKLTDGDRSRYVKTIIGDVHDCRLPELDGRGRAVLLYGKGGQKKVSEGVASGFIHSIGEQSSKKNAIATMRVDDFMPAANILVNA